MSKQTDLINIPDAITVSGSNVGIGTSSPQELLHVYGNSPIIYLETSDSRGQAWQIRSTNGGASASGTLSFRDEAGLQWLDFANNGGSNQTKFYTGGTERMRIDATGAVTMPHQPAFLVAPSGAQSNITVGNEVTVVFGTEIFDQNADFASNQFTAPVTGRYQLNLTLYVNSLDSASDYYHIKIWTSNRIYSSVIDPGVLASDPVYWNIPIAVLADMDLGDIAKVTIKQNNGTAQTDIINETTFSGYLVA